MTSTYRETKSTVSQHRTRFDDRVKRMHEASRQWSNARATMPFGPPAQPFGFKKVFKEQDHDFGCILLKNQPWRIIPAFLPCGSQLTPKGGAETFPSNVETDPT